MEFSPQIHSAGSPLDQLVLVESTPDTADVFFVGARAQLRSGGPAGLVVGVDGQLITVAWAPYGDRSYPAICFRRLL